MIFNIFKTLLCAFLIFLSCFIADVRGKSINELEEFDSSELNSKVIQETTSEESVLVSTADPCELNPCENGGSCTAMSDTLEEGFYCICPVGYIGEKCETDRCSLLQCREHEICVVENDNVECKLIEDKDPCEPNPCENGGYCIILSDLSEGFSCSCSAGFVGEKCEIDKCDGMNCQNNGTCYIIEEIAVCKCPDGYTGDECEKHECDGMNCQNNGTCYVLDGKAACKCPDGYTGDECEKVDLCSEVCGENPGVVCDGDKTNRDAIMCFCKDEEKIFDQDEKDCKVKEVDLCLEICGESPAVMCEGDKTNRYNITCSCRDKDRIFDQEEKKCKIKKDMNTCVFRNWYVSWETAAKLCADENSTLLCYKTRKEIKDILESFKLTTIDNAKFAIWLGNRNCTREKKEMEKCLSLHIDKSDKTEWHYFQTDCDEANPFVCCVDETNECDRVKCLNGGICNIIDGKAVCDCPIGYTGDVCEKHPCTNNPCLNGGQCIVTGTSFNCICKEPYFGKFCETNLCDQYICKNGGTCKVIREQPKCFCKEPYSGKFCDIRMDDCVTNFCENGGICRTMNGEPKCFCTEPYEGKFCNTRTDLRYNSTVFAVVYMLLGLVLISIGVLISCLLCRRICLGRK